MRFAVSMLLTTAMVAAAAPAFANAAWPNWYLGVKGGVAFLDSTDLDGSISGKARFNTGYDVGASLGYRPVFAMSNFGSLRMEVEYLYQDNDLDDGNIGGPSGNFSGDISHSALLLNGLYDFALTNSRFSPYVGGGIGIGHSRASDVSFNGSPQFNHSDNKLAYDLQAGIGYSPETVPYTTFTIGYRYFGMSDTKFGSALGNVKVENDSHNIEAGAQFRF